MFLLFFYLAEEDTGSLLKPDFSLLVSLLLFIFLIFVLNALVFKPITKVLDERERLTGGAIAETKQALRNYDQRLSNYHEQIRSARAESYRLLETQRQAALGERGTILTQVKTEATKKIEAEKQQIDLSANEARKRLESDARTMAESISRNLLKRPLGGAPS